MRKHPTTELASKQILETISTFGFEDSVVTEAQINAT